MRLLLDTATFLWIDRDQRHLVGGAARRLLDGEHYLALSDVSVWEMCIKVRIGKLSLGNSVGLILERHRAIGLEVLPIERKHILLTETLPLHHRDPFDRLIAAQSLAEGLPLLSPDGAFDGDGVARVWD